MTPEITGNSYDKIAKWWQDEHHDGQYGVWAIKKVLSLHSEIKSTMDIGCGSGGRFVREIQKTGSAYHGIDVSKEMIRLANINHPQCRFEVADICEWSIPQMYDLVFAWDSIFHVPYSKQESVVTKICNAVNPGGVIMYTFGNAVGEHTDHWMNDTFYYSSLGIRQNLELLSQNNMEVLHLELDQFPDKRHVVVIGRKAGANS